MIIWYLIMQPNIIDDTVPYLSYFYNFYATHFAMSSSSNGKKKLRNGFILIWNPLRYLSLEMLLVSISIKKRATRCTKAPAYAGSGKGSHHYWCIVCSLTLFFIQEAVSRTWTRDLLVTWQQLYQLRQGYPSLSIN